MSIKNSRLRHGVGLLVSLVGLLVPVVAGAAPLPPLLQADLGMRPNQRLSYLAASATVGAAGLNLVPDANGRWVDVRSGVTFAEGAGTGGAGVSVFDVHRFNANSIIIQQTDYLLNTVVNAITLAGQRILVGNGQTVDILWARPANLAATPNTNQPNFRVSRLVYNLDGRNFNAIRIQANVGNAGWTQSTYDLQTGLLLIKSQAVQIPNVGTGLTFFRLTSGKRVTLPGMANTWPASIRNFRTYNWIARGTGGVFNSGGVVGQAPIRWSNITWTDKIMTANVFANNQPSGQIQYTAGSIGSPWMAPGILGQLRTNGVLDDEPNLQYRIVVGTIQNGFVNIRFFNRTGQIVYKYRITTGDLTSITTNMTEGIFSTATSLTFVSRQQ